MIVNPSFYKTETTNGDTNHYNTGTPSAHKKKRIRSDVVEKKMKKLKTSNWSLYDIRFKKPDVEFTQENFEHQCWEHLKDFSRDLLQILLIIRYLTGSFDKLENVNELKDGIEELSVLFELFVKPYAKMNEMFKTEYDIYEFIVDFLGFNYAKMKYGVTLIKVPEFFTNINNQKDICFF
jgi:predicted transcriptional regulator